MQVVRPECRKLESPFGDVAITAVLRSPATKLKMAIREEIGALPVRHFPQSSSASRVTADPFGFFILSQSGERPER
jgi:hypothetical protein